MGQAGDRYIVGVKIDAEDMQRTIDILEYE